MRYLRLQWENHWLWAFLVSSFLASRWWQSDIFWIANQPFQTLPYLNCRFVWIETKSNYFSVIWERKSWSSKYEWFLERSKFSHQSKDTLCEKQDQKSCNLTNCRLCPSIKRSKFHALQVRMLYGVKIDYELIPCHVEALEFLCRPNANLSFLLLRKDSPGMNWRKPIKNEKRP